LTPNAAGEAGAWADGTGDPLFGRAWTLQCMHLPPSVVNNGLPIGL
jgi:hypothetical protein